MSNKPDLTCDPHNIDGLLALIRARPDLFGKTPSREQRADFAYGNTKLSNPEVTRAMVERAIDKQLEVCHRLLDAQPWEVVDGEHDLGGEA